MSLLIETASSPSRAKPWGCSSCQLPELLDLAGEDRPGARSELGLATLGEIGVGAEERDREVGPLGAEAHRRTELAAVATGERGAVARADLADDRQLLAGDGCGDLGELGGGDVAPGEVAQQVADRPQPEALLGELALLVAVAEHRADRAVRGDRDHGLILPLTRR